MEDIEVVHIVEEEFVNTKKAALTAIGALAEYTGESFLPYLQDAFTVILEADVGPIFSIHTSIRSEALSILQYFVVVAKNAEGLKGVSPTRGESLTFQGPVVPQITSTVLIQYLHTIANDDEKIPVAESLNGIYGIVSEIGTAALMLKNPVTEDIIADKVMEVVLQLLSEQMPCQHATVGDDDEDDDHDNVVMDSVSDLIGGLAKAIGPNFAPYFDAFSTKLLKFAKDNRPHTDRSMAIGCFAEVILEIGPQAVKYLEMIIPAVQAGLTDTMESVRRNSAFCVGAIAESLGSVLSANQVLLFLQMLYPLCVRNVADGQTDCGGADIDNALSAVSRMITNCAPGILPLAQVLPVLLAALPLRVGTLEGPSVYGCLIKLVQSGEPTAISHFTQVVSVLGKSFTIPLHPNNETKALISSAMKSFASSPQLSPLLSTALSQIQDQAIVQAVQTLVNS
jgi:hypothetical protein